MAGLVRGEYRLNTPLTSHRLAAAIVPKLDIVNTLFFYLGALINVFSYLSLAPVIVAAIFYLTSYSLLVLTQLGGAPEKRMFSRVFSVGFLMAGIAAVYANQFLDEGQLFSDPAGFFDMASSKSVGMSLIEIQIFHEGALGIILWRAVYDFFAALGFEKARYIGITVNVTVVALTGVIAVKCARHIFGNDEYRFRRLTLLVAACGLFWLFAGIHMRDSVILFAVTVLSYAWIYFLAKPDLGRRLGIIVISSFTAAAFIGFLRGEFVFVPFAMAAAAIAALLVGRVERRRRLVVYGLMLVGSTVVTLLAMTFASEIVLIMDRGQTLYSDHAAEQHGADSLGMALIVNQPAPIRLVLGSIYMFVFPIPFWSGFQLDSVSALFKSANVIYLYFVLPLLLIALRQLKRDKATRSPALLFMVFLSLGFTLAIAGTSLETRHFGAFFIPVLLLATLPDLRISILQQQYKSFVYIILTGVLVVHLAWIAIKL